MPADPVNQDVQRGYDRAAYGVTKDDLEKMGERSVRDALNSGKFEYPGHKTFSFVSAWLADTSFAREIEESAKRDAREDETLEIAKAAAVAAAAAALEAAEANKIASSDRRIAITAIYIAAISAMAAIVAAYAAIKFH